MNALGVHVIYGKNLDIGSDKRQASDDNKPDIISEISDFEKSEELNTKGFFPKQSAPIFIASMIGIN